MSLTNSSAASNAPWYFVDVMPTLAEIAGATCPSNIDGISILPTLLGRQQRTDDRFLYWEFPAGKFQQAVRWGNFKAIRSAPGKPLELYDLSRDIAEKNDIAAENPDVIVRIEKYLKTAPTDSPSWPIRT